MRDRLPASSPASSPSASATYEPENKQEQERADCGVDDRRDNAGSEVEAELGQQPVADECTDDSDDNIADDPEPGALHDLAGQPSGSEAHYQDDQETFTRHVHVGILLICQIVDSPHPLSGSITRDSGEDLKLRPHHADGCAELLRSSDPRTYLGWVHRHGSLVPSPITFSERLPQE